jgi:predicted alpha/beta-hydrolase family hydrolase
MTTFDVALADRGRVSARLYAAAAGVRLAATFVLAHGAGAPHTSPFIATFAEGLAARGLDVVTFNFPYMEARRRLPDPGRTLEACYAAVVRHAATRPALEGNRLVIGGKSMGGRIASQLLAHDAAAGARVAALVVLGYPLHPPGKPQQLRTSHLPLVRQPMLCVQGERDAFGTPVELAPVLAALPAESDLFVVDGGDHSFKVPKKLGVTQADVYTRIQDAIARWTAARLAESR